jgi:RNA polymerase sigma-70 factor (ECF subfamily)
MASERQLHLPLPFDDLMQRYEREIIRYLLRSTRDREEAADLFQETWLRAYGAYSRIEPESNVRAWLYAIATNLCRNRVRDNSRRASVIVPDNAEFPAADTIGNACDCANESDGYAAVRIRELISRLPAKQRQALHLRHFAGLEFEEIATAMKCSQESARANVSQAMRRIRVEW